MATHDATTEQNGGERAVARGRMARWAGRLGLLGFMFFLIKGLVWIAVFAGGARLIMT